MIKLKNLVNWCLAGIIGSIVPSLFNNIQLGVLVMVVLVVLITTFFEFCVE